MGRTLSGTAAVAVAVAAWANHVPSADAFSPAMIASTASAFGGPSSAVISRRQARSRRPSPSMKVAGAQPQQQDAWLAGGVKTRELFNALSQGEIG
ncbi:unnamed protein product, partial [Ectocarpus sp. 13 AM-2016]